MYVLFGKRLGWIVLEQQGKNKKKKKRRRTAVVAAMLSIRSL